MRRLIVVTTLACVVMACADDAPGTEPSKSAGPIDLNEMSSDGGSRSPGETGAVAPATIARYATKVVSFTPGRCAGFGADRMPEIVMGPPKGAGDEVGSFDVLSLGNGGEIVLSFEPSIIVDRPGIDFVVFENAFYANGDRSKPFVDLAEVSVSDDGETWTAFPCTATEPPYGDCAGWRPVYASEGEDPATISGGDVYDLATIGVSQARFVRIKDNTSQLCTSQGPNNNGFDLDAVGVVHAVDP